MYHYTDDTELYAAFERGDTAAIQQIYQLHFKPLCFFAERITGSAEEAQDLVTESFIKMLHKKQSFQTLPHVKSFLYLITKNACLNYVRNKSRHAQAHRQISYLSGAAEEDSEPLQEEMLRLHVLQAIHAEIEELPGRCKEIFKLLFIEGMGTPEIARQLGISPHTVTTQKARAIQLIKSGLLKKNMIPALMYLVLLFPVLD